MNRLVNCLRAPLTTSTTSGSKLCRTCRRRSTSRREVVESNKATQSSKSSLRIRWKLSRERRNKAPLVLHCTVVYATILSDPSSWQNISTPSTKPATSLRCRYAFCTFSSYPRISVLLRGNPPEYGVAMCEPSPPCESTGFAEKTWNSPEQTKKKECTGQSCFCTTAPSVKSALLKYCRSLVSNSPRSTTDVPCKKPRATISTRSRQSAESLACSKPCSWPGAIFSTSSSSRSNVCR
mmetsp:Transcript_134469/g.261849  ORF Transcript_134469/g.261849 Transcript_134469/m.261849 type:complete len:237 (-) Transcript_134469:280-990(-)